MERWISEPYSVIDELFHKSRTLETLDEHSTDPWNVSKTFKDTFGNDWSKIPSLNAEKVEELPADSLVRYKGMIQDVFDPEFFLGIYYNVSSDDSKTLQSMKYREELKMKEGEWIDENGVMLGRLPLMCVPIPGETRWSHEQFLSTCRKGEKAIEGKDETVRNAKRKIVEESSIPSPSKEESNPSQKQKTKETKEEKIERETKDPSAFPFPHKHNEPTCLIKIYDEIPSETFKLNSVFEFVGILTLTSFQSNEMETEEMNPVVPSGSLIPRIQCIALRSESEIPSFPLESQLFNERESNIAIRKHLIDLISKSVGGDLLSAEYLLLNFLSKVNRRSDNLAVGACSLNLQSKKDCNFSNSLSSLCSNLLCKSISIPLTIHNLNSLPFKPRKDYSSQRLYSAVLQLSSGTHLLLDETALEAGQLTSIGLDNVKSIGNLIMWQKLDYDFQFQQIEFPTDIPTLVLSHAKSLFSCLVEVPIVSNHDSDSSFQTPLSPLQYSQLRAFISYARNLEFKTNETVEKAMQDSFVAARKQDSNVRQDTFHLWLTLARLQALSFGETELTEERWNYTLLQESLRNSRLSPK